MDGSSVTVGEAVKDTISIVQPHLAQVTVAYLESSQPTPMTHRDYRDYRRRRAWTCRDEDENSITLEDVWLGVWAGNFVHDSGIANGVWVWKKKKTHTPTTEGELQMASINIYEDF